METIKPCNAGCEALALHNHCETRWPRRGRARADSMENGWKKPMVADNARVRAPCPTVRRRVNKRHNRHRRALPTRLRTRGAPHRLCPRALRASVAGRAARLFAPVAARDITRHRLRRRRPPGAPGRERLHPPGEGGGRRSRQSQAGASPLGRTIHARRAGPRSDPGCVSCSSASRDSTAHDQTDATVSTPSIAVHRRPPPTSACRPPPATPRRHPPCPGSGVCRPRPPPASAGRSCALPSPPTRPAPTSADLRLPRPLPTSACRPSKGFRLRRPPPRFAGFRRPSLRFADLGRPLPTSADASAPTSADLCRKLRRPPKTSADLRRPLHTPAALHCPLPASTDLLPASANFRRPTPAPKPASSPADLRRPPPNAARVCPASLAAQPPARTRAPPGPPLELASPGAPVVHTSARSADSALLGAATLLIPGLS